MELPKLQYPIGYCNISERDGHFETVKDGKPYIVRKRPNPDIHISRITKRVDAKPESLFNLYKKHAPDEIDPNFFYLLNCGSETTVVNSGSHFYVPKRVKTVSATPSDITKSDFLIPAGSYIFSQDQSAYLLERLCAEMNTSGKCKNFPDIFAFTGAKVLPKDATGSFGVAYDIFFTEKYDLAHPELTPDVLENIVIQVLFAIAAMQLHGIQHNNLHYYSIKLCKFEESSFFRYSINGTSITIPNLGFIVKIFHFRYAVKYSEYVVTCQEAIDCKSSIPRKKDVFFDASFFISDTIRYAESVTPLMLKLHELAKTQTPSMMLLSDAMKAYHYSLDNSYCLGDITDDDVVVLREPEPDTIDIETVFKDIEEFSDNLLDLKDYVYTVIPMLSEDEQQDVWALLKEMLAGAIDTLDDDVDEEVLNFLDYIMN